MMSTPAKKSVLVFIPYFVPAFRGGGPIRTIEGLTKEHQEKFDFFVFCSNRDLGQIAPLSVPKSEWTNIGATRVFYADTSSRIRFLRDLASLRQLKFDFLYLNSCFAFDFSTLPAILAKLGLVRSNYTVIAPRGEFGHAALGIRAKKKQLFLRVARLVRLHKNFVWHGSSEREAQEIKIQFPNGRVVVRQNETNLPDAANIDGWEPPTHGVRFIYVGRLSPKKRLELALEALAKSKVTCSLDVYGEFEDSEYSEFLDSIIRSVPESVSVNFHGSLEHKLVRNAFSKADYFLFPTAHENFGHTIAESLSVGCPVIIQDVTPFSDSVLEGHGFIVGSSSVTAWADAISMAAARTSADHNLSRIAAAGAYDRWRAQSRQDSVFEMVEKLAADNNL